MFNLKETKLNFGNYTKFCELKPIVVLMMGSAGSNLIYFTCFFILGFILNNENFGHFRVVYAYIMIAVSISNLGINVPLTRLFPQFTDSQQKASIMFVIFISFLTSFLLGYVILLKVPSPFNPSTPLVNFLYYLSFSISICGATFCNFALSLFQADGRLSTYSRFQFNWRALLFGSATLGSLFGSSFCALICMPLSYLLIFSKSRGDFDNLKMLWFSKKNPDWSIITSLLRGGFWPLAAISISIFYNNAEFLYISAEDIASGVAGSYSLSSLIYMGGASLLFPFQTYAVSKTVRQEISFIGIWKLQGICFLLVLIIAGLSLFGSHILNYLYPLKFDGYFLNFANLVALKLTLWGMYAVTGALLCYVGKEFESFVLTVIALLVLVLVPYTFKLNICIEIMVKMQLLTGLILLLGSSLFFWSGFHTYRVKNKNFLT